MCGRDNTDEPSEMQEWINILDRFTGRLVLRLMGIGLLMIGGLTGYRGLAIGAPGSVARGPTTLLLAIAVIVLLAGLYCLVVRRRMSEL